MEEESSLKLLQAATNNNFRQVNIYPSAQDILEDPESAIRKNKTQGKFNNAEEYLDIQFHLLREDFLVSLREGIKSYRLNEETKNIEVYKNVKVFNSLNKFNRPCIKVGHDSFGTILKDEDCKKLMRGSLLIFTNDEFQNICFLAKVIGRSERVNNEIVVEFFYPGQEFCTNTSYTMAECCVFFEPYFQVMRVLQNMPADHFPMQKYFIEVDASTKANLPKYLIDSGYNVGDYQNLENNLNSAQAEAFTAALSQEFVVIQGPPGTGKTFLGLKIVETLIKNSHIWYKNSPMIIISHKNDSLDHFLEGLISSTDKLIRVGGQSKSVKLEAYNLTNIKKRKTANSLVSLLSRIHINNDVVIMQNALVIAMTTTVAARMKTTLETLRCPIVIVEEAAEVLESHVVAALTKNCQHLILLGDHKQLKPGTSDRIIGKDYGLATSLFERMVTNGIQCYKLEVQYRMRPEISALLRPSIYPFLKDHESVENRPPILGVDKNVFFIDHGWPEEEANVTSKKNCFEAKFLVAFAKYLILNGHDPESIVILTTYSGQVMEMENEISKLTEFTSKVKVSTLDGFQGQEADIVLLSLVRSQEIGFLGAENRTCVALSRAKNGFYITGNMDLLRSNSDIWLTVEQYLTQTESIGSELVLRCQKHPKFSTKVTCAEDFEMLSSSGHYMQCNTQLSCITFR